MNTLIRKITSRKFWAAVVNFVTQILIACNVSDSEVAQVAAIIMAGAGVIAYIIGEGLTDAANVQPTVYGPYTVEEESGTEGLGITETEYEK